ncbi:hypothetical protein PAECIP111893_01084 [Paenibacillus plantiphilus]|uniref:Uncharacterized protein n=1 Tax=Paenibacillus plantiphilus TaxID=2905650 RepID=A0ABM9BYQ5_9BACL|nr:hypothetical protein PAECIP111893_01084 [Paenibacillus plantiphilus]
MIQSTATRERLTSALVTLHHPFDYYFNVFLEQRKPKATSKPISRPISSCNRSKRT